MTWPALPGASSLAETSRDWADRSGRSEPDADNAELERQAYLSSAREGALESACKSDRLAVPKRPLAWLARRTDGMLMMLLGLLIVSVVVPDRSPPPMVLVALMGLIAAALKQFGSTSVAWAEAERRSREP